MRIAYHAENLIDAHLVADLLRSEGLECDITGANLTAGVGELPTGGLVKVWVEDVRFSKAKDLIAEWQRGGFALDDEGEGEIVL